MHKICTLEHIKYPPYSPLRPASEHKKYSLGAYAPQSYILHTLLFCPAKRAGDPYPAAYLLIPSRLPITAKYIILLLF